MGTYEFEWSSRLSYLLEVLSTLLAYDTTNISLSDVLSLLLLCECGGRAGVGYCLFFLVAPKRGQNTQVILIN